MPYITLLIKMILPQHSLLWETKKEVKNLKSNIVSVKASVKIIRQ